MKSNPITVVCVDSARVGWRLLVLLAGLAAAGPAPVAAQELPARLTLDDALRVARSHNPEYRQALNQVDASAAAERSGWGAFLPHVGTSFSLGGSSSVRQTGENDYGQPFPLDDPIEYVSSSASQGLSLSLTLFDGFGSLHALRGVRAEARAAEAGVDAAAVRIEAEIRRRFYDALSTRQLLVLEERLLASARERLEATRELLRVARTNPEDVLGAEVDVARQEQAVAEARSAVRKQKLALLEIMGVEEMGRGGSDFEVAGRLPEPFDPVALDPDSLVRVALAAHPDVREQEARAAAAEHAADAARGGRWPEIRMSAGVSRGMGLSSLEMIKFREETFNPQNRSLSFNLSASLPLFDGFRTSAQIAQADVARRNARQQLRAVRLGVERQVRSARIDLDNAYRAVRLAERALGLSRQRLEMAQERYRLGAVSFTELQILIDRTAQAERAAIQARLGFARAVATLEEAVGREVRR